MTSPNSNDDRTAAWIRAHPRLASLAVFALIIGAFVLVGLRETDKSDVTGTGTIDAPYVIKLVALVGGALFIVWRANKRLRRH